VTEQKRRLPIRRDAVTWLFGLGGLGWMLHTGNAPWPLVIVFGLMGGVPGLSQLVTALRGLTDGSESSSPQPSLPSSLPTSSPEG
jgi:hypothetical protein